MSMWSPADSPTCARAAEEQRHAADPQRGVTDTMVDSALAAYALRSGFWSHLDAAVHRASIRASLEAIMRDYAPPPRPPHATVLHPTVEQRLGALERDSHVPFDFTHLIRRIEALERAAKPVAALRKFGAGPGPTIAAAVVLLIALWWAWALWWVAP